jgi:hypothetical protein
MPGATSRLALPYPLSSEAADGPAAFLALATALDKANIYSQGLLASRPVSTGGSPGITGRFYYATDNQHLYLDMGTGWVDLNTTFSLGVDSVSATNIAADAVGASELADNSVDTGAIIALAVTTAKIADASVTSAKIAAALKPSGGAGAATEALRAIGTTAGTAMAGDSAFATPVTAVFFNGTRANGQTYTITSPAAGTYILEWGAGRASGDSQGDGGNIQNNVTGGQAEASDVGMSGGTALRTGVSLSNGQVITFTITGSPGFIFVEPWAKLTRTA